MSFDMVKKTFTIKRIVLAVQKQSFELSVSSQDVELSDVDAATWARDEKWSVPEVLGVVTQPMQEIG